MLRPTLVLLLAVSPAALAFAGGGSIDPGFAAGGRLRLPGNGPDARLNDVVLQPDGRIVAGGSSGGISIVVRLTRDGSLDPTFGTAGIATVPMESLLGLALQPDGHIVAAGGGTDAELVRLDAGGALDPSFGTGGRVTLDFGGFETAADVLVAADGSVVAAGGVFFTGGAAGRMFAVRYLAGGVLDPGFGQGGTVNLTLGSSSAATAIRERPDGRLVMAGRTWFGVRCQLTLVGLLPDGGSDPTMGTGGVVLTQPGEVGDCSGADGAVLYPDGRVLTAGNIKDTSGGSDTVLMRFLADGSADPSFGSQGVVRSSVPAAWTRALEVALQHDGKIVVAGQYVRGARSAWLIERHEADGQPDASFGVGGRVVDSWAGSAERAFGLAIQSDGEIVVTGSVQVAGQGAYAVSRYLRADAIGDAYCDATSNSTGVPARLRASGSTVLDDEDVLLVADQLPTDAAALFLMSPNQGFLPMLGGGQGNLCIAAPLVRITSPPMQSGSSGQVVHALQQDDAPPALPFLPGQAWNFQLWHRDQNPGPTSNTTAGVTLTWR